MYPHFEAPLRPGTEAARMQALHESTSRLLAAVVNEKLVHSEVQFPSCTEEPLLVLRSKKHGLQSSQPIVSIALVSDIRYNTETRRVTPAIYPEDMLLPAIIVSSLKSERGAWFESDPVKLWNLMFPWFGAQAQVQKLLSDQIGNAASNQVYWSEFHLKRPLPTLRSSMIEWEWALGGHPTHPMHRACIAQEPLAPVSCKDITMFMTPEISLVSLPKSSITVCGPFEALMQPLFNRLNVPASSADRIIAPCMTRQMPAIQQRLGSQMVPIQHPPVFALSQASIRTVQLPSDLDFPYNLKLAFAVTITGQLRTISHWTAQVSIEASELLKKLVPSDLWIIGEVASITGSLDEPDDSRHLTCLLREDIQPRADLEKQCLIVAGALGEVEYNTMQSHAERLFGLDNLAKKKSWFRTYAAIFLRLALTPLVKYGVCMETHRQNMVCRFDRTTKELKGFAYRDMGGLRLHTPTLLDHGYELKSAPPGSSIITDNLEEVWGWAHYVVYFNHLGPIMHGLKLQREGGWEIVQQETIKVLDSIDHPTTPALKAFLLQDEMVTKCFMRMKLAQRYRGDPIHEHIPNPLLS